MIKVLEGFIQRYFKEEEAIILVFLLFCFSLVIWWLGSVLAPLLWSLVISYMLQGLVNTLIRWRVPRQLAVYLVFAIFLGAMILLILVFLPFTWNRISLLLNDLPQMLEQVRQLVLLLPERYPRLFNANQLQAVLDNLQNELGAMGQTLLSYSVTGFTRAVSIAVYVVLVPIMVFFMLKDSIRLLNWIENWLPKKRPVMAQIWHEMNDQLANYIRGKGAEIIIVGSIVYLVLLLLKVNYALLLAVLIGFSVIIPYIGATVATIPVAMVGFFQWGFSPELGQLLIIYIILQVLDGNILVPLIFSETVNLHPLAILAAVLVFGGIWGFWGVFFAIPLATFLKAIMRAWPVSHPFENEV
jgi:putative permease